MMTKVTALSMALVPNMGFPKLYQVSVSVDFHWTSRASTNFSWFPLSNIKLRCASWWQQLWTQGCTENLSGLSGASPWIGLFMEVFIYAFLLGSWSKPSSPCKLHNVAVYISLFRIRVKAGAPGWFNWLSSWLHLRSRSGCPGMEPWVGIPAQWGLCFSNHPPTLSPVMLSLSNTQIIKNLKRKKKKKSELRQQPS